MQFSVLNAWMFRGILQIQIACCALLCKFHVIKWYVLELWSHKITNAYRTMKHGLLQGSNYDGVITMLDYVFINLNLCCIQWYKFHVCRGKGLRDTVTQIYPCDQNHEKWFISRAHSSISNGMSHYFYISL